MAPRITLLLSLWSVVAGLSAQPDIYRLIARLDSVQNYRAVFSYRITLPITDSEVEYHAELAYAKNQADPLCGYRYRIDYKAPNDTCPYYNFAAYDSGNYFRFDRGRLREYHHSDNPEPFVARESNPGVHRSGLFTELFPAEIAKQLTAFIGKKDCRVGLFTDTLVQNRRCDAVVVSDSLRGEPMRIVLYTFDPQSGMPLYRETENNPGHLGSQTVVVSYRVSDDKVTLPPEYFGEQQLLHDYGETFSIFREGTYAATDRIGQKSPHFSLPWNEQRFTPEQLQGENALLLFLDEQSEFCTSVRQIAESISLQENITPVFFYVGQKPTRLANRSGAIILEQARKIAGEYGVTGFPTLFLLDANGIIRFVKIGYSPQLPEQLSQAVRLLHNPPPAKRIPHE